MTIYQRGDVWYDLFYINGRRYRGSTKTKNSKQAERVEARKRVAAEARESLRPKRVPLVRDFAKQFVDWLDKTTLEQKTKDDYKNGRRLILKTPLAGMRMDQITADAVETTRFHESPHSRNCAIRTLRRTLGKARDWKLVREVPRIKSVKVFPRDRMVTVDDEKPLLAASPRPWKDVLTIMLDSGLRNGDASRMRLENINWDSAFYFNPRGKTRKARRPVPLSDRVIALLRNIQQEQLGQREGWVFPSKKTRAGHIGLSELEHMFRNVARRLGIPDALKLYCARHTFGTLREFSGSQCGFCPTAAACGADLNHRPLGYEPKGSMLSPVDFVALPRFQQRKSYGFCTLVARDGFGDDNCTLISRPKQE